MNQPHDTCICGHVLFSHIDENGPCWMGPVMNRPSEVRCTCMEYKRDNLRFLESKLNANS